MTETKRTYSYELYTYNPFSTYVLCNYDPQRHREFKLETTARLGSREWVRQVRELEAEHGVRFTYLKKASGYYVTLHITPEGKAITKSFLIW